MARRPAVGTPPACGVDAPQGGDPRARPSAVRIDLSTCVCRYGPPPGALAVARDVAPELLREHPYGADAELVAGYAHYLAAGLDLDVAPDELVAGRGVSELIWRLAAGPLGPRVVVPQPAYTEFRQAFPHSAVGPPGLSHDLALVAGQLAAGAVVLLANPNNPTGRAFDGADLVELARAHPGGVLVVDESYVEFCAEPARISVVGSTAPNLVVLRSPSKFFGLAGCRVGVAWSPSADLRDAVASPGGSWPVSALEVRPVLAALADHPWIDDTRTRVQADGAWLERQLGRLGQVVEGSTTHARLVLRPDAAVVAAELARVGLGVRVMGQGHGLEGPALRISAARDDERPAVAAMLGSARPAPRL